MNYKKIPLSVYAVFLPNGTLIPKQLYFETQRFTIDQIVGCKPHNPGTVSCIAPIEYKIMVEGQLKKVYFEPESLQWFSVKEIN